MKENKVFDHILIVSYAHPELYPPIISMIHSLSDQTKEISVVTRYMLKSKWNYPNNVEIVYVNKKLHEGFEIENISILKKLKHFLSSIKVISKLVREKQTSLLIVHDVIPLFISFLLRRSLVKNNIKIWYHNHDVTKPENAGKYSLMGIAARYQKKAFPYIDLFSLPARERLKYFPLELLKRKPIVIPNYPLKKIYQKIEKTYSPSSKTIKLVYQGSIGVGHGLEVIIKVLTIKVNHKQLELHLVGKIREEYLKKLKLIAVKHKVSSFLYYHGMKPFSELAYTLSQFDIGLAIHQPYNITYATGGSASNKIYEYAACGLPVLYFDDQHYNNYLSHFEWTFSTDLSQSSLEKFFNIIINNYLYFSNKAKTDFEDSLNYERIFKPLKKELNQFHD